MGPRPRSLFPGFSTGGMTFFDVIDLMLDEQNGNTDWLYSRQIAVRYEASVDEMEEESDTVETALADLGMTPNRVHPKAKESGLEVGQKDGRGEAGGTRQADRSPGGHDNGAGTPAADPV